MATLSISGRMSVKTVKKNFMDAFGGSLRILKDGKLADDGATMASLKAEGCKGGELELKGNTKVAGMKKKIADLYGISVEVYDADGKKPVDDGLTLASIGTPQTVTPTEKTAEKNEPKEKPAQKAAPVQTTATGFSFDQLLDAALADGVLTDKERAILLKKATAQGLDPDETELIIDGRLAKMKPVQQKQVEPPKQEPPKQSTPIETKQSLKERAEKCLKIGDDNEAIKIYKKIIMDYDEDWECFANLFKIYENKGDYKEALKFGTRLADLTWDKTGRWTDVEELIRKMFDEMLNSNRKRDASRFLDNYGKYLDKQAEERIRAWNNPSSILASVFSEEDRRRGIKRAREGKTYYLRMKLS